MHGTAQIIWRESHCILLGWQPRLWFQPSRLHFAFLRLLWCQWQPRLCQVAAAAQLQQCQASPRTSLCILPSRLHRSSVHSSSSGDARGRVRQWWWGARGAARLLLTSLCPCPSDISPGFGFLTFLFIKFIPCTRALWLLFFSVRDSSVCFSASICSSHRCLLILPGIKPHYTPFHSSSASLMRMLNGTSPDTYTFAIILKKPTRFAILSLIILFMVFQPTLKWECSFQAWFTLIYHKEISLVWQEFYCSPNLVVFSSLPTLPSSAYFVILTK